MSRLTLGSAAGFSASLPSPHLGQFLIASLTGVVVWTQKTTLVTLVSQAAGVFMLGTPVKVPEWVPPQTHLITKQLDEFVPLPFNLVTSHHFSFGGKTPSSPLSTPQISPGASGGGNPTPNTLPQVSYPRGLDRHAPAELAMTNPTSLRGTTSDEAIQGAVDVLASAEQEFALQTSFKTSWLSAEDTQHHPTRLANTNDESGTLDRHAPAELAMTTSPSLQGAICDEAIQGSSIQTPDVDVLPRTIIITPSPLLQKAEDKEATQTEQGLRPGAFELPVNSSAYNLAAPPPVIQNVPQSPANLSLLPSGGLPPEPKSVVPSLDEVMKSDPQRWPSYLNFQQSNPDPTQIPAPIYTALLTVLKDLNIPTIYHIKDWSADKRWNNEKAGFFFELCGRIIKQTGVGFFRLEDHNCNGEQCSLNIGKTITTQFIENIFFMIARKHMHDSELNKTVKVDRDHLEATHTCLRAAGLLIQRDEDKFWEDYSH